MSERRGVTLHERDQCAAGLQHAGRLLHEEFDGPLGADEVDAALARVTERFARATVLSFVPLLVRRYARDELLSHLDDKAAQLHMSESALLGGSV